MGQKVNPIGLRVGITRTWESRWFSEKNYAQWLREDMELRKFVRDYLVKASAGRPAAEAPAGGGAAGGRGRRQSSDPGIARIEIERAPGKLKFIVHTSRPGQVIGKGGMSIDDLKKELVRRTKKEIFVDVKEVRKPDADAQLVAESIAQQIERRLPFRRAMKRAITMALKSGAEGVRVRLAGRLGGAEMSRVEAYREGRVPLHTLRADIDFGYTIARTTYGAIGCKVWIYRGEVLSDEKTGTRKRIAV